MATDDHDGATPSDTATDDDPDRQYIRIRPADDPLTAELVTTQFRRLHRLRAGDADGFLARLLGRSHTPVVEWLLVSEGADAPIEYYVGLDEADAIDTLERALRGLLPDTYEFDRAADPLVGVDPIASTAPAAAVTYCGRADRRQDWQTQLTSFDEFRDDTAARVPLAGLVETMADASVPIVYQTLLRPRPDWSGRAHERIEALRRANDTLGDTFVTALFGTPDDPEAARTAGDEARIEETQARNTRRSFAVNARLAIGGPDAAADADVAAPSDFAADLAGAFSHVSHTCYAIEGRVATGRDAADVAEAIAARRLQPPSYERVGTYLPWRPSRSRGIVADPGEAPNFCLLDGDALTAAGARAVVTRPGERTAIPRPPVDRLARYHTDGLVLGRPLTQDGTPADEPIAVPPSLQRLHVAWLGGTGAGKSTGITNGMVTNTEATAGPDILLEPKGDGMAEAYLRAHYARDGDQANVLYFDCAEVLPAFAFFDIRAELDAGVPRTTAVEDKVDHYLDILTQIMGRERFEQAVRAPDVIRYLVKALFDPVHGQDAFSHRELHTAARQMHERESPPAVSDADLERMLGGVVANRARSFDEIMQGVANRLEKIPVDRRLARVFNHVPDAGDPQFDLADYLSEDTVVVFDMGDLRPEAQRVLTLVILSNLWTALRRRSRRTEGDQPLVNLYVEEAASIAVSDLLQQLLAQARGFDASVTLSMQFPGQVRGDDAAVYDEVLNNVSTVVTGNVPADRRLAERLATDAMDPQAVANRLRALRRGQWLVRLPAAFDEPAPRPFLVQSLAPPPGDPAGDQPFAPADQRAFEAWIERVREWTADSAGLTLDEPATTDAVGPTGASDSAASRVDSALPHTKRMPPTVRYDESVHALRCTECGNLYDPDSTGMHRAIDCCSSLAETDPADIPICKLHLKLDPEDRAATDWSDQQLMFLQAVYNAQQRRYDPPAYDLLHDSMLRLQEYVGIDSGAVQDLVDADLLRHDTDHPHRLYSVTPDGRQVIGESYRQGVDYGHGAGDLEESTQHVFAIEVARRYLDQAYVQDPDSDVVEVVPYYDIDERRRLDIAGLDADGSIVVAVEAERVNNDLHRAVPADFDKIADCDPDEAIWVVMTQSAGHEVLGVLNDPPEGEPRVAKTYASSTPPQQFTIETPGMTAIYPVEWLRDQLDD